MRTSREEEDEVEDKDEEDYKDDGREEGRRLKTRDRRPLTIS